MCQSFFSDYSGQGRLKPIRLGLGRIRSSSLRCFHGSKTAELDFPVWKLLNTLPKYRDCMSDELENSRWLEDREVNIPSTVV
jgi:hypothetical protein